MNFTRRMERDQFEMLRPQDVGHYLTSRDWEIAEDESSQRVAIYRHRAIAGIEIVLPIRRDLGDYALRMSDLVQTLASLEDRPIVEILNDLSSPAGDLLRLCVASPLTTLGSLPLDDGIRLFQGGRDLLLSAACSTTRPRAFHPEKTLKQANDFIKKCRVGQTERGSFVATIITPVVPNMDQPSLPSAEGAFVGANEPFARQVTSRLMTGLHVVDRAIKTEQLDLVLGGIDDGVSANLCDALVTMKPRGEQGRLDIRMAWSRSRPSIPAGIPASISFAEPDFATIEYAADQLRKRAVPGRDRFTGQIHSLHSEIPTLFEDIIGKIVLRTSVAGQGVRIKVVLNREDYQKACDAHRDGKRVAVTGMIHHDARVRVYELSEPGDFEVLND